VKNLKIRKLIFAAVASLFFAFYCFSPELFALPKVDIEQEYSQLFTSAEKTRMDGKFEESIRLFEKSLRVAKKITDKKKQCDSLLQLGILYWNIGLLKESSVHYEHALQLAQKFNLQNLKEKCQNSLEIHRLYKDGKKFRSLGENRKSIESFRKAIELAKKIKSLEHEVKCHRQMSYTYWELSKLKEFFSLNQEALKIAQRLKHEREKSNCLISIGNYYWKLDSYSEALNSYQEAFTIAQRLKNKDNESICLTNIGGIYEKMGNYDKALEYLTKALTIDKQLGDNEYILLDLNIIGTTFRTKGLISGNKEDFLRALDYYNNCLKLTKKTEDRETEVEVLNNIGTIHTDLKNSYEALKYFKSGYEKAEEIKDVEAMGMILTNIGIVYYNQGNYEKSTEYYQEAIDLANRIEGDQILWEAYMESARAYEKQNKFRKAKENYEMSINTIETIRTGIELEENKASFLGADKRIDAYHYFINLLLTFPLPHPEEEYKLEAYNYLEKAKARAFLDSLELSKIDISQEVDAELLNRKKEIEKNISNIYTKIRAAELSPEDNKRLQGELERYENELGALKREMRIKSSTALEKSIPMLLSSQKKTSEYSHYPPEKISKCKYQTI